MTEHDAVNHPAHYTQERIECIDAMEEAIGTQAVIGFCLGNMFKYMWRYSDKNGKEDVEKALWYFNRYKQLINKLEGDADAARDEI